MPYWKCFLWTAVAVAVVLGIVGFIAWLNAHAPDWIFSAVLAVLSTAILAILPWLYFK